MDLVPIDRVGSRRIPGVMLTDSRAAPEGTRTGGSRGNGTESTAHLDPRVIVAPGPKVRGSLARHREFYLKPPSSLVAPGDTVPYTPALGTLSYRGQLGILLRPTERHTPADRILDHVEAVVLAAEVVSIDRLKVGWEGTMWHVRYGEGGAFDGSCPVGPVLARIRADEMDGLQLDDGREPVPADVGAIAEFLAYVSHWLTLGPNILVLAGSRHGPKLDLDGRDPRVLFEPPEPRVGPGGRIRTDGGVLGQIDVPITDREVN